MDGGGRGRTGVELDAAGTPAPKLNPVDVAGLAAADAPKPPKPVVDAGAVESRRWCFKKR